MFNRYFTLFFLLPSSVFAFWAQGHLYYGMAGVRKYVSAGGQILSEIERNGEIERQEGRRGGKR